MTELMLMPKAVMSPEDALRSREEFSAIVQKMLKEGQDFGVINGTDKPTLLQPGADKLLNVYGLTSRTVCVEKTENWDRNNPFFMYRYKSSIVWPRPMGDGTIREEVIAECEGSANSMESKYGDRWVTEDKLSEEQKELAKAGKLASRSKAEWQPNFKLTLEQKEAAEFQKWKSEVRVSKSSGKNFVWYEVPGVLTYQVPNEKVFDQVNTLQKMAQKRAYVGATIKAVKASDLFTQDMEDLAADYQPAKEQSKEAPKDAKPAQAKEAVKPVDAQIVPDLTPYEWAADVKDGKIFQMSDEYGDSPTSWIKEHVGWAKDTKEVEALKYVAKNTLDEAGYKMVYEHINLVYKALKAKESKKTA